MITQLVMERLLYISESQLSQSEASSQVTDIVNASLLKNAKLNLTGALFFTGMHFAQILEGPSDPLDDLMKSIHGDVRHKNIALVDRVPIRIRRFSDWAMEYFGPSSYVSQHVLEVLHFQVGSEQRRATERLMDLAHELSFWRKSDEDAATDR